MVKSSQARNKSTLRRAEVGKTKEATRNLPPGTFAYGVANSADKKDAGKVLQWDMDLDRFSQPVDRSLFENVDDRRSRERRPVNAQQQSHPFARKESQWFSADSVEGLLPTTKFESVGGNLWCSSTKTIPKVQSQGQSASFGNSKQNAKQNGFTHRVAVSAGIDSVSLRRIVQ